MKTAAKTLLIALMGGLVQSAGAGEKMGPLRPDAPFGICSVTGKPRTADTFFNIFGYLPKSAGDFVPGTRIRVAQPQPNNGAGKNVVQLTQADLDRVKDELKQRSQVILDDLGRQIAAAVIGAIDKLPGAKNLAPADRTAIQQAVERGDPAAAAKLLSEADRTSPAGRDLANLATARQQAEAVRKAIGDGSVGLGDLRRLATAVSNTLPRDVLDAVGQTAVNTQVAAWIADTQPGNAAIPTGDNVPIALVPGLPPRQLVPLGPAGPVLVGIGPAGGNRIVLGVGNVRQAAGLPQTTGRPVEEYDNELYASTIVVANVGKNPVKFVLNNYSQYPMTANPGDVHNLRSTSYTITFDRGGGFGEESYRIGTGYYEFTPTERGWDLFKTSFKAVIENPNEFDFHYVLNNQSHFIGAGKSAELAGDFPSVLRFEDGRGQFSRKQLTSGTFKVAVDGGNALDLYPATAVTMPRRNEVGAVGATVSVGLAPSAATAGFTLPAGFRSIDPVAMLTDDPTTTAVAAQKLPAAFSLFADGGAK